MKTLLLATVACALSLPAMAQNNAAGPSPAPHRQQTRAISPSSLSKQEIKQVQMNLNRAGFDAKHVDGRWGQSTRKAVRNFQQLKHLPGNGKLNQQTLSALGVNINNQSQASNSSSNPNREQPRASSGQTARAQQVQVKGNNGMSSLTSQQKQMIAQDLARQSPEQMPANLRPRVGEKVPQSLKLNQLPGSITSQVQSLKGDDFAKLNDGRLLIVNPSSKQIVAVINEGATTGTGANSMK
jgi:peptidoglycan hydrolase-like protein with peptidoglycan-binding domain